MDELRRVILYAVGVCLTSELRPRDFAGSTQLAKQPKLRDTPVALHRVDGHLHRLGGFLDAQAPEKTKFDHLRFALIDRGERGQRAIDIDDVCLRLTSDEHRLVE